eukprot:GEMP01005603.1.p1 GENE.GEMP01005603.1~~GEMP01005603.1.p1  ORF type:complete len:438 (+),score=68.67 GEMP01005603.1:275-1588(+)
MTAGSKPRRCANTHGGYECCFPLATLSGSKIPTGPTRVNVAETIIENERRPSAVGVAFAAMAAGIVGIKPLHVVGLLWFKELIDVKALRTLCSEKLLEHERFRSKVRVLPYEKSASNTGCPLLNRTFVEVPVDIEYHVTMQPLPGLNENPRILEDYLSELHNTPWDMEQPLWRMLVVPDADKGGRCLIIALFDHCIGDGVSFVQVLISLMDDEMEIDQFAPPPKRQIQSPGVQRYVKAFAKGIWDSLFGLWQAKDPPNALKLKESTGHLRIHAGKKIPLERFKELQAAFVNLNATLNDIFVAILTLTVYRYLETKSDPILRVNKPKLHVDIPYDLKERRVGVDPCDMGNHLTYITLRLPLEAVPKGRTELMCNVIRKIIDLKISPKHHIDAFMNEVFVATTSQLEAKNVATSGKVYCLNCSTRRRAYFPTCPGRRNR